MLLVPTRKVSGFASSNRVASYDEQPEYLLRAQEPGEAQTSHVAVVNSSTRKAALCEYRCWRTICTYIASLYKAKTVTGYQKRQEKFEWCQQSLLDHYQFANSITCHPFYAPCTLLSDVQQSLIQIDKTAQRRITRHTWAWDSLLIDGAISAAAMANCKLIVRNSNGKLETRSHDLDRFRKYSHGLKSDGRYSSCFLIEWKVDAK